MTRRERTYQRAERAGMRAQRVILAPRKEYERAMFWSIGWHKALAYAVKKEYRNAQQG